MKNKGKLNIPGKTPVPKPTSLPTGKRPSIMIAVPAMEMVNAEFAQHLAMASAQLVAHGIKINCAFNIGSVITIARRNLVDIFLKSDFEYIWWVDSDMKFPIDAPLRLLARNKDIVGCNYLKRTKPLKPVAYKNIGDWDSYLPLTVQDELVKVEGVGMGCILMKTEIFKQIQKPYFEFTYNEKSDDWLGEDFNLLTKFRNIGYEVYIDTLLSSEIKHMGLYAYGTNK